MAAPAYKDDFLVNDEDAINGKFGTTVHSGSSELTSYMLAYDIFGEDISRNSLWNLKPLESVRPISAPKSARTLLSSQDLENHGLRYMQDAGKQSWIIRLDDDNLVEQPASSRWLHNLADRISELRCAAIEEELPFSERSASSAYAFASQVRANIQPGAFLLGNGNIRLLWSKGQEQVGLQFMTDQIGIQYVMFAKRDSSLASHMGADNRETIFRLIGALGLRHLLG